MGRFTTELLITDVLLRDDNIEQREFKLDSIKSFNETRYYRNRIIYRGTLLTLFDGQVIVSTMFTDDVLKRFNEWVMWQNQLDAETNYGRGK